MELFLFFRTLLIFAIRTALGPTWFNVIPSQGRGSLSVPPTFTRKQRHTTRWGPVAFLSESL